MRIPFPNISSNLAMRSHMYICLEDGPDKKVVKCQTFKPIHCVNDRAPFKFIKEEADITRNPFLSTTTIDCDKAFSMKDIIVNTDLLTELRRDICEDLFVDVLTESKYPNLLIETLDPNDLITINRKLSIAQ